MKVSKLIKELTQMNGDAEVRIGGHSGFIALFLVSRKDDESVVWLESENDIDMGEELSARFSNASEEQIDELDFYMELLDIGISVECVRTYMGDECADHMQTFCIEHGLLDEKPMNRIEAIKAFRERKEAEVRKNEKEEREKAEVLKREINTLQPRIKELLDVANACLENGIPISSFVTNSISHCVGFAIDKDKKESNEGLRKIEMLGINAGGACGHWHFRTNGKRTFTVNENDIKNCGDAKNEDMMKFLSKFDEFEKGFYGYVDEICCG